MKKLIASLMLIGLIAVPASEACDKHAKNQACDKTKAAACDKAKAACDKTKAAASCDKAKAKAACKSGGASKQVLLSPKAK